jgi:hypothetical protein
MQSEVAFCYGKETSYLINVYYRKRTSPHKLLHPRAGFPPEIKELKLPRSSVDDGTCQMLQPDASISSECQKYLRAHRRSKAVRKDLCTLATKIPSKFKLLRT